MSEVPDSVFAVMRLDLWSSFEAATHPYPGAPIRGVDKSIGCLLVYETRELAEKNNQGFAVIELSRAVG